jgi:hypothetical protein
MEEEVQQQSNKENCKSMSSIEAEFGNLFFLLASFTTTTSFECYDDWKEFVRKRLWHNRSIFPAFAWRDCGEPQKISVRY